MAARHLAMRDSRHERSPPRSRGHGRAARRVGMISPWTRSTQLLIAVYAGCSGSIPLVRRLFPPEHSLQPDGDKDYRDVEGLNRLSGPPGGVTGARP